LNDVSKTIGWADFSWNPLTGCWRHCPYCYARRIATRFAGTKAFPDGFKPTFHPERLNEPLKLKKPSKIFVCSMGEIFSSMEGDMEFVNKIIQVALECPQHTFQFLTHKPYLYKLYTFPQNCWLGATINNNERAGPLGSLDIRLLLDRRLDKKPNISFVSFEPLLADIELPQEFCLLDWVILGGQTGPKKFYPLEDWIKRIEEKADEFGIPVYEKSNLRKEWEKLPRREFPKVKGGSQ